MRTLFVVFFVGVVLHVQAFVAYADTLEKTTPSEKQEWLLFSKTMSELSQDQAFVDAFLQHIGQDPASGGILGPKYVKRLREIILGKEFEKLDRFPGMTVKELGISVKLAAKATQNDSPPAGTVTQTPVQNALSSAPDIIEDLGLPVVPSTSRSSFHEDADLKDLGFGLRIGDKLSSSLYDILPDSTRLANILSTLAQNEQGSSTSGYRIRMGSTLYSTPEDLVAGLIASGHDVKVFDTRYFANFGDVFFHDTPVMTGFWLDTRFRVPGTNRPFLVPVSHSQHEIRIQGPLVHAAISFYFGIDGICAFRPIKEWDQPWIFGTHAHTYTGSQAVKAVQIAAQVLRAYIDVQKVHPHLPFGGYYTLGVCNDANAMVEMGMQGKTTLYPITLDQSFFISDRPGAVLARRLPVDARGQSTVADPEVMKRIIGALPISSTDEMRKTDMVGMSDFANDIDAMQSALDTNTLEPYEAPSFIGQLYHTVLALVLVVCCVIVILCVIVWKWVRGRRHR